MTDTPTPIDQLDALQEGFSEQELIAHGVHPRLEHVILYLRNLAVGAAAVLFLASFALEDIHKLLRAAAYFLGAGAYFAEILVLTDGFRQKVPQKELFMAYCFGPLYILLGLSYLLEA